MSWPLTLTISAAILLAFLFTISPPPEPITPSSSSPTPIGNFLATTPTSSGAAPTASPSSQPHLIELDFDDFADVGNDDDFNAAPDDTSSPAPSPSLPPPPSPLPQVAGHKFGPRHLVTRVIDGDTIEVNGNQTVRLIGINTPESVHPRQPVACFGKEASAFTRNLLLNQSVWLEPDVTDRDRYGRLLRYVYLDDIFVNEYLVAQGYAHSSPYPPDLKHQGRLDAAANSARTANRGLWAACPSEPPAPIISTAPPNPDCQIKGNINSSNDKIYHEPACPYYSRTRIDPARGEQYFCSSREAETAGWRRAQNCP